MLISRKFTAYKQGRYWPNKMHCLIAISLVLLYLRGMLASSAASACCIFTLSNGQKFAKNRFKYAKKLSLPVIMGLLM
jgi:hypothetical protein